MKTTAFELTTVSEDIFQTSKMHEPLIERGVLYLVATPIGNLWDITLRALKVLEASDIILCEDTRRTLSLLKAHHIRPPQLVSFYREVENKKIASILDELKKGKIISLVSDAGTPAIQDPGYHLVKAVWDHGLRVSVVPGPSAIPSALAISGLPPVPHYFWGFFPRDRKGRIQLYEIWRTLKGTHIVFETGRRLSSALKSMPPDFNGWPTCLVKELTKIHETRIAGFLETIRNQMTRWAPEKFKGEWVILIYNGERVEENVHKRIDTEAVRKIYANLKKAGLKPREAIHLLQELTGIPANKLYSKLE